MVPSTSHNTQVQGDLEAIAPAYCPVVGAAAAPSWAAAPGRRPPRRRGAEQARGAGLDTLHALIVQRHAADAAVGGEHFRLRLDLLGGEHPGHRREVRIAPQQLEIAGQLLDTVDVAAALDLDGDRAAGGIAQQQVDGTDRRRELASHEREPVADDVDLLREQALQVGLDAVLLQARIDAELVCRVVQHLVDAHEQRIAGLRVGDPPVLEHAGRARLGIRLFHRQRARRAHPVQRLVRPAVGVDEQRPVALVHEQARRERQMRVESAGVIHGAAGDDKTHPTSVRGAPDARVRAGSGAPAPHRVHTESAPSAPVPAERAGYRRATRGALDERGRAR